MTTATYTPPVTRAYTYLNQKFPGIVEREHPPDDNPGTELIIIKSAGGIGHHSHQLLNARLTFETRAPTAEAAEALAYRVHEAIRQWQWEEDRVYLVGRLGVPVWDPEPDERIPAYTWTAEFNFKGVISPF